MGACGLVCFRGLAKGDPVRVGLDIARGVELKDNELYGCVVAKSHSLENQIAGYPRIAVEK